MDHDTAAEAQASPVRVRKTSDMDALRLRLVTDDTPELRIASHDPPLSWRERKLFRFVPEHEHRAPLRRAIARGRQSILARQRSDGSFGSPRIDDPGSYVSFVLLLAYLDQIDDPRVDEATDRLLELQSPAGGWARLSGEADDLSTTVLSYFALKLSGLRPNTPAMQAALRAILRQGGAANCEAAGRWWLALFAQVPLAICCGPIDEPTITTILAQAGPKQVSPRRGIRELFLSEPTAWPVANWDSTHRPTEWETEVWQVLRLAISTDDETAVLSKLDSVLKQFTVSENEPADGRQEAEDCDPQFRLSSSQTDVIDTALAVSALQASGLPQDSSALRNANRWLENKLNSGEVNRAEEHAAVTTLRAPVAAPHKDLPPALELWSMEGPNRVIADNRVDDQSVGDQPVGDDGSRQQTSVEVPDVSRIRRDQQPDGSWASLPTSSADTFELFSRNTDRVIATAAALSALGTSDLDERDRAVSAGVNWLLAHQGIDGSWQTAHSTRQSPHDIAVGRVVEDRSNAAGEVAYATAIVTLALLDCGITDATTIEPGIDYLLSAQFLINNPSPSDESDSLVEDQPEPFDLYATCQTVKALSRWLTIGSHTRPATPVAPGGLPTLRIAQFSTAP